MSRFDPQSQLPAGWKFEWETFPSSDHDVQIFQSRFSRDGAAVSGRPPTALYILHGMGEHSGRYARFADPLQDTVDWIGSHDHRGHGRSEGLRGDSPRFDLLVEDSGVAFQRFVDLARRRLGDSVRFHLLGHSMGGLIALRLVDRFPELPLSSVTLSAPLLEVAVQVPAVKRAAAGALKHLWGTLQLATGLPASDLSRVPEEVALYEQDRLNHDRMTPRFFDGLTRAMAETRSAGLVRELPVQFLVPLADRVVSADATVSFAQGLRQSDKRLKTYPEGFHEAMHDLNREEFFRDLRDWIRIH